MQRILLTGATGFIGSHVARQLIGQEREVIALIRPTSDRWRIDDIEDELHVIDGDLLNVDRLKDLVRKVRPDLCIHMAWYAEPGKYLDSPNHLEMLSASIGLARSLAESGCQRFVGIGTCFEYEMTDRPLTETSVTRPGSMYAASKTAFATVLDQIGASSGMETAWLRPFYQYGPHEDERRLVSSVVLSLLRGNEAATTEGEQVRDFLHVEDVAAAIVAVAYNSLRGVVNVGSGEQVTVRQVARAIGDATGRGDLIRYGAMPYRESDPVFVVADNSCLRETGWEPRFDLYDGIADTVRWWQERMSVVVL